MGGGVMRTAFKAAAALGRYRHAAGRRAPVPPPSATVPVAAASPEVAPISLVADEKSPAEAPMVSQWPACEAEDWYLADWEGEESLDLVNPAPRLVFGPPPTMEEAELATSDLMDALDRVYFSPTPEVHGKHDQGLDNLQFSIIPSMPEHVTQAFSLLQGSPEAQNVVASLAADKYIWDAVIKNEKVMEFCRTHHSSWAESVGDSPTQCDGPSAAAPKSSRFADFVDAVKNKVAGMVRNISHFIQDFLRTPAEAHSGGSSGTGDGASTAAADVFVGASFVALAVAVIVVVLVKRI